MVAPAIQANPQKRGEYWQKEAKGLFCFGQALAFATQDPNVIITRVNSGDQYCLVGGVDLKEWNGEAWVGHYRALEWFLQSDWMWRSDPSGVYNETSH
jgi:hypothetical protein